MKILITGTHGLLGQYLLKDLSAAGHSVIATGRGNPRIEINDYPNCIYELMEITDEAQTKQVIEKTTPDIIVHAAAMAQPDACELDKDACIATNIEATRFIAAAAKNVGAKLVYISTDFVFSGDAGPYKEEDAAHPINFYGQSKLDSEAIVQQSGIDWAIVRTVLVYGNIMVGTRSNMVTWVKDNLEQKKPIKVVSDQVRTPTYVGDLSKGIVLVIEKNATGIFHISGEEVFTPYEMAVEVADFFELDKSLMEKVDASVFTQPAKRPLKTGFIIDKAKRELGYQPISFQQGIREMFPR